VILVIAEHRDGSVNRATWETIAAAQQLSAGSPSTPVDVVVAVPGFRVEALGGTLAAAAVREVVLMDDPGLERYTPDGYTAAVQHAVEELAPALVVFPHTYQTRDFAPMLATRLDRALIADVTSVRTEGERLLFTRPMFQGRLAADVVPEGPAPHFVTFQVGAFRADHVARSPVPVPVRPMNMTLNAASIRQVPEPPFQQARQSVDLSQAERIVSVGRGIRGPEHLVVAERLAAALGAELGASRPICDAGWLPMDRQVGSSGQTVTPKLYVALGISGAIQHLVGMKGSGTIVAVNRDPDAPIFEVADYGIVGDLFEVVPAMVAALETE
jgi:electron transfer flavoprotein alpha subunit